MAFKVEMVWGRPPGLTVYGSADDGESIAVRYIPSPDPPDPEWREFTCPDWFWEDALELGRREGWKPLGTRPSMSSEKNWKEVGRFDDSYNPESWGLDKELRAEDAAALARALQRALDAEATPSPAEGPYVLLDSMTRTDGLASDRGLHEGTLRKFVAFLRKGPFRFAWDD